MRAPASSTLRISTRCCSATESDSVILRGSMLKPSSAALSLIRCSKAARRWRWLPEKTWLPGPSGSASWMFSATVKGFTSLKC